MVVDGLAEQPSKVVEGVRGIRVEGVHARSRDGAVQRHVDHGDVVGGHLGADRAAGRRDEAEQPSGPSAVRGDLLELDHETTADQRLGGLGHGGRADAELASDLRTGQWATGPQETEDGRRDEVAAAGCVGTTTPLFVALFSGKLSSRDGPVKPSRRRTATRSAPDLRRPAYPTHRPSTYPRHGPRPRTPGDPGTDVEGPQPCTDRQASCSPRPSCCPSGCCPHARVAPAQPARATRRARRRATRHPQRPPRPPLPPTRQRSPPSRSPETSEPRRRPPSPSRSRSARSSPGWTPRAPAPTPSPRTASSQVNYAVFSGADGSELASTWKGQHSEVIPMTGLSAGSTRWSRFWSARRSAPGWSWGSPRPRRPRRQLRPRQR